MTAIVTAAVVSALVGVAAAAVLLGVLAAAEHVWKRVRVKKDFVPRSLSDRGQR